MFLVFIMKWAIALTLLYSLYGLFLSKETFYTVNRCVLLSIIVISAVLPFVHITTEHHNVVNSAVESMSQQLTLRPEEAQTADREIASAALAVLIVYMCGLVAMTGRYVISLVSVLNILRGSKREEDYYINDKVDSPFSWFNYIVISKADIERNGKALLAHERVHAHRGHSYDLLLCDICCLLQWFNPFAWMLKEDLCAVHEYEADYGVTHCEGVDYHDYQMLLIDKATEKQLPGIVNSINRSSLKHRLKQMYRKPSSRRALLKVMYVLPLSMFVMYAFASPETIAQIDTIVGTVVKKLNTAEKEIVSTAMKSVNGQETLDSKTEEKLNETIVATDNGNEDIIDDPDIAPQYEGGEESANEYIARNVQYPDIARRSAMEGRIVVGFVVKPDGSLTDLEVLSNMAKTKIAVASDGFAQSDGEEYIKEEDFHKARQALEQEALRIVKSMTGWNPAIHEGKKVGSQSMLTIYFSLND